MRVPWTAACLVCGVAIMSPAPGCEDAPRNKVTRRATPEEMPGSAASRPVESAPTIASSVVTPTVGPAPVESAACHELVERACQALGPHSDECQEAKALLPLIITPEHHAGCSAILDAHVRPSRQAKRRRRLNSCRRLMRAVCGAAGGSTWVCRQTRADASRLWRTGQREACLGDLLLFEARRLLSGLPAQE